MINGLDLFSGIGGLALALEPWVRPIAYCEKDQYAVSVLLSRQASGEISTAPIWDDVRTLGARHLACNVDIITAGFPCQDVSLAGARVGLEGKRSGLFWEVVRLAQECSPTFVFLENVWPGVGKHVPAIRSSFEKLGYQCRDGHLSAADVGANHLRERWFFLAAHSERVKLWNESGRISRQSGQDQALVGNHGTQGIAPHAQGVGLYAQRAESNGRTSIECLQASPNGDGERLALGQGEASNNEQELPAAQRNSWWASEPAVGRLVDGFPDRLARARHVCGLHALGNAVVPEQARQAFMILMGVDLPRPGGIASDA